MKKLLYTLLIGLVIVSCQKEEYGGDYAPAALSTDIEATIEESFNEDLLSRLISDINSGVVETSKKIKSASTARFNSTDWLYGRLFTDGTNTYFVYSTEGNTTDWCVPEDNVSIYPNRYYENDQGDGSNILISHGETGTTITNIPGSWASLFGLEFTVAYKLNDSFQIVGIGTVDGTNITF